MFNMYIQNGCKEPQAHNGQNDKLIDSGNRTNNIIVGVKMCWESRRVVTVDTMFVEKDNACNNCNYDTS